MSRKNVELVQSAWKVRDREGGQAALTFFDEAVEVHDPPDLPGASVRHGHDGFLAGIAQFVETFPNVRWEVVDFIDVDDEQVICIVHATGRGASSDLLLEATVTELCEVREGKIVSVRWFRDRAQALAFAGGS
jgi:ketosteroid isomerase-like protein